ncbi:MAG: MFS transporter [Promethearchaeota archaeon]|jgi:MFS family permease
MKFFKADENRYTHDYTQMLRIVILNSLGFFFLGFWIPIVAEGRMGATFFQIGLLVVSNVIGRMISGFITGFISDRIKSRTSLVLFGSFGRGISYFIIYAAFITNNIFILGIGHTTLGFCAGVFWVPFNILVAEKSNKEHRAYAYGKRDATNAIGQIIGATFGFTTLMIATAFTDNPIIIFSPIPIYGVANFIAGIIFNKKVDESIKFSVLNYNDSDDLSEEISLKHKVSRPTSKLVGTILLLSLLFLASINGNIARPYMNLYVIKFIEDNVSLVVWAYLPTGLIATLFAPKLGKFVDKLPPLIGITITWSLGSLMTWLLISASNIWVFSFLLLFDLMIGMSAGLIFQNFYSRISTEHRGKVFGVGDFFSFMGAVIGPLLGGLVWDLISPQFPFIISIFVELSLIPLYLTAVYLLIPHMAESYQIKKKNKMI